MAYTYNIGQVVRHKRYGYRGVVVGHDPVCKADEAWYQHNQTQPDRDQPWYHVLVDQADHTTYVAQENLEPDKTQKKVNHPLINRFFVSFFKGRYHTVSLN